MGMTRTMEESRFTNIEKGTYAVTCIGVRPDKIAKPQFGDGSVIKFTVRFDDLVDDEGEPLTRETMASDYLTPGSKLTKILHAFGVSAEIGQSVDIEDCLNREALAVVGEKRKDDKVYDTIDDLVPAPKRGAAPATRAAQTSQQPATAPAPSVVNSDGSANYDAFWRGVKALGLNRVHVANKLNGDVDNLQLMDGPDVAFLLEELKLQVEAAV